MAAGKTIGKTIVLLFLVIILILIGLVWFDYLGIIQAKQLFAPIYRLFGLQTQSTSSVNSISSIPYIDLDSERLVKRLESLDLRSQELDKREQTIQQKEQENLQISQELEDLRISQEEREKTFNNTVKKYDDREVNIVQNARNLTGMAPQNAVNILLAMDDQDMIDTLRKVDEISAESGSNSMVPYWLSLMPADRVAQIQRKMTNKPTSLQ